MLLVEFVEPFDDAIENLGGGTEVASKIPAVDGVAEFLEVFAQGRSASVTGEKAREDEDGSFTPREVAANQWGASLECAVFADRRAFAGETEDRGSRHPCQGATKVTCGPAFATMGYGRARRDHSRRHGDRRHRGASPDRRCRHS